MAARDRFSKKLTCPQCGNSGFAEASEDDRSARNKHPGFKIDQHPRGFFEQRASNFQESYIIRCECGRKFPFKGRNET